MQCLRTTSCPSIVLSRFEHLNSERVLREFGTEGEGGCRRNRKEIVGSNGTLSVREGSTHSRGHSFGVGDLFDALVGFGRIGAARFALSLSAAAAVDGGARNLRRSTTRPSPTSLVRRPPVSVDY